MLQICTVSRDSELRHPKRHESLARRLQASRLRKSHVAKLKVNTAINAIGQVFARTSLADRFFKYTPFMITIMYRKGFKYVNGWSQSGMFSIGLA